MCVCVCVCVCVYIHVHTYVCVFMCVCVCRPHLQSFALNTHSLAIILVNSSSTLAPPHRNPEAKERPNFPEVAQMLQAVEASVLLSQQDKGKGSSTSLGQPLKSGYNLYKDLQEMYM